MKIGEIIPNWRDCLGNSLYQEVAEIELPQGKRELTELEVRAVETLHYDLLDGLDVELPLTWEDVEFVVAEELEKEVE